MSHFFAQVAKVLEFQLQHQYFQWIFRTGWISLQSKGLSRVFSNTTVQKYQFFWHSAFFIVQLSYPYMATGKTIALTGQIFVVKVMSLLFNTLSRLVIAFLPRSKCLNFMTAVTICSGLGAPQNKVCQFPLLNVGRYKRCDTWRITVLQKFFGILSLSQYLEYIH